VERAGTCSLAEAGSFKVETETSCCASVGTRIPTWISARCAKVGRFCVLNHLFRLSILISKFQILIGIIAELQIIKGFLL
jgi:hypothetical protein